MRRPLDGCRARRNRGAAVTDLKPVARLPSSRRSELEEAKELVIDAIANWFANYVQPAIVEFGTSEVRPQTFLERVPGLGSRTRELATAAKTIVRAELGEELGTWTPVKEGSLDLHKRRRADRAIDRLVKRLERVLRSHGLAPESRFTEHGWTTNYLMAGRYWELGLYGAAALDEKARLALSRYESLLSNDT